jgi:hypothetical protein
VIFIYGTRMFGESDQVPGIFAVRTRFAHFNYLPLFPTKSFLMFTKDRGVELPGVQWGSALMGWLRAALVIACGGLVIAGLAKLGSGSGGLVSMLLLAALCGGAFWYSYRYTRATKERALELCKLAQLSRDAVDAVEQHFAGLRRDGDTQF